MNKNYLSLNNSNIELSFSNLTNDLDKELVNKTLNSKSYGSGKIISVNLNSDSTNFAAKVELPIGTKTFLLSFVKPDGAITTSPEIQEVINSALEELNAINKHIAKLKSEEERKQKQLEEEAKEEAKRQERIKKAEIKRELMKKNNLKLTKTLDSSKIESTDNLFIELGYIAKNVGTISAAMPDYLENWFISTFGKDAPHRAVDQTILSPSGLPSQYALALKATLKTNKNIPVGLIPHLGDVNKEVKPISDTEYVFNLVREYGFQFGRKQDIDKILENVPSNQLENFKLGMNLA